MNQPLNYETAYAELKQITFEIESEKVSVDVLAEKVKRASELITFCQTKLRTTEEEVTKIIQQMETGMNGRRSSGGSLGSAASESVGGAVCPVPGLPLKCVPYVSAVGSKVITRA